MTTPLNKLQHLAIELQQALDAKDAELIAALDNHYRELVATAVAEVANSVPVSPSVETLISTLRQIDKLYTQAIALCRANRDDAHRQLHGLNVGNQGVRAYQSQTRGY